ncbi:hypothetical protein ACFL4G_07160, partial [Thermodesulfobacteriota bacterium]
TKEGTMKTWKLMLAVVLCFGLVCSFGILGCSDDDGCNLEEEICDDADGDVYTDTACGGTDCDDADSEVNPGMAETLADNNCEDEKDNDCDGLMDGDDADCVGGICFIAAAD